MPQEMRVLSVFIASPGGVAEERDAVEAVAGRLNASLGRIHNIALTVRRYEQIVGRAGNAQEQINVHADDSDIFIGVVHRRWGSDTGNGFDSGFHEEFTRALRRWEASRTPRIALFFKDVDTESLADPGEQLAKVLEFKRTIEADHIVFYNRFSTAAELEGLVTSLLAEELANVSQATRAPEGEGAKAPDTLAVKAPRVHEPVSAELVAVVEDFSAALGGGEVDVPLDVDRFELLALSVSRDSDRVPTHLANRLYARRQQLNLIHAERRIWFREYLRDVGRSFGPENRVVPLAAVVGREWITKALREDAAELVMSDDANLRDGAISLIRQLGIRPKGLWPRQSNSNGATELQEVWAAAAGSSSRAEIVRYWLTVRRKRDHRRASELAAAEGHLGDVGRALEGLLAPDPRAFDVAELDVNLLLDPLVRARFSDGAPERTLSDEQLAKLVDRSYISDDIRALALQELANRDRVPASVANSAFASDPSTKWGRKVNQILFDREVGANLVQSVVAALVPSSAGREQSERRRRTGDVVAMLARRNQLLDSALSAIIDPVERFDEDFLRWRLLRSHGDASCRELAVAVLKRTDAGYLTYLATLDAAGWDPETKKFVQDRIDLSVLCYLSSLPNADRDSVLARSVRALARDEGSLFRREAMRLLVPIAKDGDIELLIENVYALDDREAALALAFERSSLKRLRTLALGDDETLACLALAELGRRDRALPASQLKRLLRSPIAKVRLLAVDQLVRHPDSAPLEVITDEYIRGQGTHYYNVVCYIDNRIADLPT